MNLTEFAKAFNSKHNGIIVKLLGVGGALKCCETRILYNVSNDAAIMGIVGLGPRAPEETSIENIDLAAENVRRAVACVLLSDSFIIVFNLLSRHSCAARCWSHCRLR